MATSPRANGNRGLHSVWIVFLIGMLCIMTVAGAALTLTPSFARGAASTPTGTHPWSMAEIAKPTYTPSPYPTSTATPLPTPTNVPLVLDRNTVSDPGSIPQTSGQVEASGKYVLVSISEQHLTAYENGQIIYSFVASTGMRNSTRVGSFTVLDKIPNAYGATWDIWMPNWLGIYYSGTLENGIHALPILPGGDRLWSGYLGTPISFGCVVLGVEEAQQLYDWVEVGTPVEIRW